MNKDSLLCAVIRAIIIAVVITLVGCIYIAKQGSYQRSDSIVGSNKVMKLEIKPQ